MVLFGAAIVTVVSVVVFARSTAWKNKLGTAAMFGLYLAYSGGYLAV